MKTTKEYFEEHKKTIVLQYDSADLEVLEYDDFERALTEHDNEIKVVIDEMIEDIKNAMPDDKLDGCEALTELKNKLGVK